MIVSMDEASESTVQLSLEGELQWTLPGMQIATMRQNVVQRSPILLTLYSLLERSKGKSARVSLPRNLDLQAWLEFAAPTEAQHDTDRPYAENLLQVLLVCASISVACLQYTTLLAHATAATQCCGRTSVEQLARQKVPQ